MSRPAPAGADRTADAGVAARSAALDALLAVTEKGIALDAAVDRALPDSLEPRDRGFARLLVTTALRRGGQIDWIISRLRDREGEIGPARLLGIVRLGIAQIVYLRTPAYAAVSSTLGLLEGPRETKARGFVNALLRQADRQLGELLAAPEAGDGPEGARLNMLDWLREPLARAYGAAQADAIAVAHLGEPPLDLSTAGEPSDWAERLEAEVLPTGSLRRSNSGMISDLPGFAEGSWWVQDAAAALPAQLFGSVAGRTVVDLCAAPGGKTAQLAAAGAKVIALDRSERRLARLKQNLGRLNLPVEAVCADATAWQPGQKFQDILLDAPCSATGTIRRHPDILWSPDKVNVQRLVELQDRLLRCAVDLLAPGGMLVWCTCSLLAREGEERTDRLLASGAPLERVPVTAGEIGGLAEAITPLGEVRTLPSFWPGKGGMDGFHIARFRHTG